jgi:hypothetical protein
MTAVFMVPAIAGGVLVGSFIAAFVVGFAFDGGDAGRPIMPGVDPDSVVRVCVTGFALAGWLIGSLVLTRVSSLEEGGKFLCAELFALTVLPTLALVIMSPAQRHPKTVIAPSPSYSTGFVPGRYPNSSTRPPADSAAERASKRIDSLLDPDQ